VATRTGPHEDPARLAATDTKEMLMFQLTSNAAMTIGEVRRQREVPENYGVRLSGQTGPSGELGLQISFVESPAPSDTVAEQHGTHIFIAQEVVGPLSDVALDVSPAVSDDGSVPETSLVLRPQDPDGA
jgi:Fe-S cluster assembly iron-binding protein IscA